MKKSATEKKAVMDFVSKKVDTQVAIYKLEKKEWIAIYEATSPKISYSGILEPGHKVCLYFKAPVRWDANLETWQGRLNSVFANFAKKPGVTSDSVSAIGGEVTRYGLSATIKKYQPKKKKKKSVKKTMYKAKKFYSFYIYLVDGAGVQFKVEINNRDVIPQHKDDDKEEEKA